MSKKTEPWYVHVGLWAVIVVLVVILIQVTITEPTKILRIQKYNKEESRLRMFNLKQAQIIYENNHDVFTDNLDTLISFVRNDSSTIELMNSFDTVNVYSADGDSTILRSKNPFRDLVSGPFCFDSLFISPRSGKMFVVNVDTLLEIDTVINRRGRILRVDSITTIGTRYVIQSPDSDDKIGDVNSDALLNTESW